MDSRKVRWCSSVAAVLGASLCVGCLDPDTQAGAEQNEEDVGDEAPAQLGTFGRLRRDAGFWNLPRRDAGAPDCRPEGPGGLDAAVPPLDASTPQTDAGSHGGGGHGEVSGIPCAAAAVVSKYCGSCHGAKVAFGAPMSLVSATDFQRIEGGEPIYGHVKARVHQSDPRGRMPPASAPQPSPAELAVLDAWLDQGAPTSSERCGMSGGDVDYDGTPIDTTGLTCYRLTAHSDDLSGPFPVGQVTDKYYNFTFTPPWKGKTVYGIVLRPVIDNMNALHHWLMYQDSRAAPEKSKPAVLSQGTHPSSTLLAGWAPGGQAMNLRPYGDVGLELPGNVSYTIEFHYNSSDPSAKDASGVEICVQDQKPANIAGQHWLGHDNLGAKSTKWKGTCRPTYKAGPIHIVAVVPHMHKTGVHMKSVISRVGGATEVLHDAPFDFNYQVGYSKDVRIQPGDSITTECTYSEPQKYGPGTSEEMCYLFTLAYPKNSLQDNGLWGKLAGTGACLGQ